MDSRLVRAKLHQPPTSLHTIPRPQLIRRLHNGLAKKVTLVSAPAGFGKSTVVSAWLDQLAVESPTTKISWLSLEEADDQIPRFIRYLVAAIEENYLNSCAAVMALLYEHDAVSIEVLADTLAEALTHVFAQNPGQLVLVLDDLHLLNSPAVYAFLTQLIQHTTNKLHMVLITRVDPPLPLNRWRAQNLLSELRIRDLGFTLAETTLFLQQHLEVIPDPKIIEILHDQTEGWAVGLRLVMLALQAEADNSALVAGIEANSNRYIIDYLVDDVLDHLSPSLQQFSSGTAILTRFCPALCAAVLEIDESSARQQIAEMAHANLFLIELSSPANWYRFHHQFQSMLLSRLHERYDQQAIADLHRRAALWLADHGQLEEALRHLKTIPDFETAAELIERQRVAVLNEQRFDELDVWLAMLPVQLLNQRPALLIALAWVQNYWLNDSLSLATLTRAEAVLHLQDNPLPAVTQKLLRAEILALSLIQGRIPGRAESLAAIRQSWQEIRDHLADSHWNTVVTLAHTTYFLGDGQLALEMLVTTFEQATAWSPMGRSRLLYSQGILYWYDCNLGRAERLFQESLYLARQHDLSLAITLAKFGLALVSSARNHQDLAEAYWLPVINEPQFQNGLRAVFGVYGLMTIYAAQGRPEAGRALVEGLKAHALVVGRAYLLNQVEALEAYQKLLCGDLPSAWHWAMAVSRTEMYRPEERAPLIRAQILIAEGSTNSLNETIQMLQGLGATNEIESRWSLWIEKLVLEALAWNELDRIDLALSTLGRVVLRAVPNGVVGPFIVQGKAMEALLRELGQQPQYSQYVQLLLKAFPVEAEGIEPEGRQQASHERESIAQGSIAQDSKHQAIRVAMSAVLPEPLSDREQEVLELLVGRLSNKEIAQRLIISPNTVRNHTANIFGKLQVENRIQAVERARSLGILPSVE